MLVKSKNKNLNDWMISRFLTSIRQKQYLSMKCKKHPNNLTLALNFKKYKHNFTKTLRLAKLKFYENKFKNISLSPKWRRN